ncbi:hypothetical protein SCHPADRAFT_897868 [Schizopora paradoxa]|uniref:Uncharacterized protein n=1 Tax=Schizopora paradoxa TaxID=27342 RepID=A0A0H2S8N7_9AGAM|nr:hypothetical protein SCHPADRAFT_897868 [Schizopora paradoxa]
MFGIERDPESDMIRVWHMVQELSEQLSHNQKLVAQLKAQAVNLKNQIAQNGPGYALRRFNVDISKETFESELERQNAQIVIDNQTLQQENRQLSSLLKEFEQTLETVMAKFRNHAYAAQQHEMTLTKHYEALLLSRETASMNIDLNTSAHISTSIQRLSHFLRLLLRSLSGDDPNADDDDIDTSTMNIDALLDAEGPDDWVLEREIEIARLTKENEELRRVLGIDAESAHARGVRDEDLLDAKMVIANARRPNSPHDSVIRSPAQQPHPILAQLENAPPQQQQQQNLVNNQGQMVASQASQQSIPLQPGMRAAAGTIRRPSLIGQRGRGGGASLWATTSDRPLAWPSSQSNSGGGGLDLGG